MGERPPLQRCSARGQCEIPKHDSYLSCHTNQPMSALTCLLDRRWLFAKCKLRAKISFFAQIAAPLPHPHPWTIPGRAAARAGALGRRWCALAAGEGRAAVPGCCALGAVAGSPGAAGALRAGGAAGVTSKPLVSLGAGSRGNALNSCTRQAGAECSCPAAQPAQRQAPSSPPFPRLGTVGDRFCCLRRLSLPAHLSLSS